MKLQHKKSMYTALFLIFLACLPGILSVNADETVTYTKGIPFKLKSDNYVLVTHGGGDSYVIVEVVFGGIVKRGLEVKKARIKEINLQWTADDNPIPPWFSTLKWIKHYVTLWVGPRSSDRTYIEYDDTDPWPWGFSGTRYDNNPQNWVNGPGAVSVEIETEIKYKDVLQRTCYLSLSSTRPIFQG